MSKLPKSLYVKKNSKKMKRMGCHHHFLCRTSKVGHFAPKFVELNLNLRKIDEFIYLCASQNYQ